MIIECKKRAEGYKPVKGNEKEIINHLLDHYGECYVEKYKEEVSFHIPNKTFFINDETTFFKCGKDGQIHIAKDKYNFKNYVAVPFDASDKDMLRIFQAPNFVSFKRKHTVAPSLKKWGLTTTTKLFTVRYGDILIFDGDGKIVDCLMNGRDKKYETLLACNDYEMIRRYNKREDKMKRVHLNIHDDLHQYLLKVKEEAGKTDYNITISDIVRASIVYFLTDLNLYTSSDKDALLLIQAQNSLYNEHMHNELNRLPFK